MENLSQVMSSRAQRGICAFLVTVAACSKDAPPPSNDLQPLAQFDLDSNRTVEIIGLRRWSPDMIRDSLKKYAPDEGLDSDAAAANLRNLLGFSDAATTTHSVVFDEDDKATTTLLVREPGDSALVRYQPQALDTVPVLKEWLRYTQAMASGRIVFPDGQIEAASRADSGIAREALAYVAGRRSSADFDLAVKIIDSSTSMPDRAMAALLLANFPERDGAWRSLLKAAVGLEQGTDAFIAQRALGTMSERSARPVDWSPMTATIHDVLDGTALAALAPLSKALAATGATTAQAVSYLAHGGEMLAASVESDNPDVRDPVHDLLVKLRGEDLGFDPGPWRDWIKNLK
jgi:hypothetical protein